MHGQTSDVDESTCPSQWVRQVYSPNTTLNYSESQEKHAVSIVVLAKDEERCIARCLDSVVDRGFDDILVVDTGSTDKTLSIVAGYQDRGVRLIQSPWPDSFAQVRNSALESVAGGWVVFVDADEWLTERAAEELTSCLASLSGIEGLSRLVFAPRIFDVDRGISDDSVPRIFRAGSGIRFRGPVHEYPVVDGDPGIPVGRVGLVGLDIEFRHDGYTRAVVEAKKKRERNLALLEIARASDPDNPRWLYFTIRDALPLLDRAQIVDLCAELQGLVGADAETGDLLGAREYYCLAISFACQGLVALGDWRTVHHYCDQLDGMELGASPDAHYFRTMSELLNQVVTNHDLLRTIKLRGDEKLVASSAVDPSGRHLDALIIALLERLRGRAEAIRYLELCEPWNDVFFENSVLRKAGAMS